MTARVPARLMLNWRLIQDADQRQMHLIWRSALYVLQQRRTPGRLRELRVDHLVRPAAEPARVLHPHDEVRVAAPPPVGVLQPALVDHVRSAPHGVDDARRGRLPVPVRERHAGCSDDLNGAPLGTERRSRRCSCSIPRYRSTSAEVQRFAGALAGKRARKGVFITTSSFSSEATAYAASIDTKIILIPGARLADLVAHTAS